MNKGALILEEIARAREVLDSAGMAAPKFMCLPTLGMCKCVKGGWLILELDRLLTTEDLESVFNG